MAAVKFSISIAEETKEELKEVAKLQDRSVNWIINNAIEEYLKNYKKEGGK